MSDTLKRPVTLQQAIVYFSDPDRAFRYAIELRWPDGRINCPRCGSESHSFLKTRRIWFCNGCKKQFTLKVGTIFEDSALGMDKWMTAVWMLVSCKNGISSYELARVLGITQKSAWHMLHRIREAMRNASFLKMGGNDGGPTEIDETHFGPNTRKMHASKRSRLSKENYQKPAVMGMLDREPSSPRQGHTECKARDLQNEILNQIERGSKIYTDSWPAYDGLTAEQY